MRLNQRVVLFGKVMVGFVIISLLVGIPSTMAQESPKIRVWCLGSQVEVEFFGWLADEMLTVWMGDLEIGTFSTNATGSGKYLFPAKAKDITLQRVDGDTILAGRADCSQLPVGELTAVSQYQVTLPVGGRVGLSATGTDSSSTEIPIDVIWIAELGSITAAGDFTATTEGQFLITANHIGTASSSTYQITAEVTPPLVSLEIEPAELTIFTNQGRQLTVIATDESGNVIEISPDWDTGGGGAIIPANFFVASLDPGDYTLTTTIAGTDLSASIAVQVLPLVDQIQITPEIESLEVGAIQEFAVIGFDVAGNEAQIPVAPTWTAELGVIDAQGKYAATTAGEETVTAVVDLSAFASRYKGPGLALPKQVLTAKWMFPVVEPPDFDQVQEAIEQSDAQPETEIQAHMESVAKAQNEDDPISRQYWNTDGRVFCASIFGAAFVMILMVLRVRKKK